VNISQIEKRENELRAQAGQIQARFKDFEAKGSPEWMGKSIDRDMADWKTEWNLVAAERKKYENGQEFINKMAGNAGSLAETKAVPSVMNIPTEEFKGLFDAVQRKLPSFRVESKAPFGEGSFTSGSLPPVLLPQLTQQLPYEPDDLFAHLIQMKAPEASSVEWLSHTGNANPAAATAELAQKPDLGMELTTRTQSFTKIAALASFSTESLQDFSHFMGFVPAEMFRALIDARTDEIVNGSGSSPHMLGLLNQSGTLTRAIGSDTPVDCLKKAFNDLRVGTAYARANLVAMHPTTWADIQLQKSTGGLYLLNPTDPNAIGDLDNIFGVRVITNTWIPAGTAIVVDTSKAVLAWTRQAPSLEINQYGTNEFNENYVTFRVEERVAIGVQYPTALNIVTGLPSS
jgi:HK97 family phage major capsid protein